MLGLLTEPFFLTVGRTAKKEKGHRQSAHDGPKCNREREGSKGY